VGFGVAFASLVTCAVNRTGGATVVVVVVVVVIVGLSVVVVP
jgi:hypothetical protein